MRMWEIINEEFTRPNLNDAFWAWFGKSKVVDDAGRPLMVYHGTTHEFDAFDPAVGNTQMYPGATTDTHFFTDHPDNASGYAGRKTLDWSVNYRDGGHVLPVYLRMVKPLVVNAKKENWRDIYYRGQFYEMPELVYYARQKGYDGLIVKNVFDWRDGASAKKVPCTTFAVFSPVQIKSVFNRGTWNPSAPSIMES